MKSLTSASSLLALLVVFSRANLAAETVDFTTVDRGPSTTLQIDGVTISSGDFGGDVLSTPATVSGVGLGSGTIGGLGTVDRIQDITGYVRESLSLTVSGSIDSVSISPFFKVVGSKEEIFIPFDISYAITGVPYYITLSDSQPFVLNLSFYGPYDKVQIGLQADFGNIPVILYLQKHPDATVQFGFSITSLNYTPTGIPESSTVTLFVIGLGGIVFLRRKIFA